MNKIVQIPSGARATKQLIDNLRNAERGPVMPQINAFRGATRQDIEQTALEIERIFVLAVANTRTLLQNLNESLPLMPSTQIAPDSFLSDTINGAHDLVTEVRGMADRLDDAREYDR